MFNRLCVESSSLNSKVSASNCAATANRCFNLLWGKAPKISVSIRKQRTEERKKKLEGINRRKVCVYAFYFFTFFFDKYGNNWFLGMQAESDERASIFLPSTPPRAGLFHDLRQLRITYEMLWKLMRDFLCFLPHLRTAEASQRKKS